MADSLDMEKRSDRTLLRAALSRGWGVTPDVLRQSFEKLTALYDLAVANGDVRNANQIMRTIVAITGQIQSDEQLDEKHARVDAGKGTGDESVLKVELVERKDAG